MLARVYLIGLKTHIVYEVQRFVRLWAQTILPPIITSALYLIIFGNLLGHHIHSSSGHTFIEFLAPGLIMMAVITNSYANTSTSFFLAKFQHSIEEILVSPLPNSLILLGYVVGGLIRGLCVCLAVTLTAACFTHLHIYHLSALILITTFASSLFAILGLINGIYAKNFDHIAFIPTFILTPLTYLGGVFYSADQLPPFWHYLSLANPIFYMVSIFRYGMLGFSNVNIYTATSIIIVITISLYCFALWLLHKGIGIKS